MRGKCCKDGSQQQGDREVSYTVQSLALMTDEERAVEALPPYLQRRMAKFALGGWKFEYRALTVSGGHWSLCLAEDARRRNRCRGGWISHNPNYLDNYHGYTLLTLLDKMVGQIEDDEPNKGRPY